MTRFLVLFSELTVAFAGVAIGLSQVIVARYWRIWRKTRNGARLLPAHVMLIGISYAMLGVVAVVRLGDPPPPGPPIIWWIYPFISLAFLLGDVSLILILRFVSRRGARVGDPLPIDGETSVR